MFWILAVLSPPEGAQRVLRLSLLGIDAQRFLKFAACLVHAALLCEQLVTSSVIRCQSL